jgi:O-antigen/teichoic acid export membrane protein
LSGSQLWAWISSPVYRSSYALIANTVSNGALGLVYWAVAAHLYGPEDVGRGAAGISALALVSSFGWIGTQSALVRFIPASGLGTARLVRTAYAVASLAALAAATCLLGLSHFRDIGLSFIFETPLSAGAFLISVIVWIVFTLEDGTLIGLRRTVWVPIENATYALAKIGLLAALARTSSPWGLLGSWSLGAGLLVIPVNLLLFRRWIPDHSRANRHRTGEFRVADIARFSIGNHVSGLLSALPDTILPIMVLAMVGKRDAAFYYTAWTITFSMRLVATNIGTVLTVEGAVGEVKLSHLNRALSLLGAAMFLPLVLVVVLAAHPVLRVFGGEYAAEAATLLRLLSLAVVPFAVTSLFIGVERVRRRVDRLVVLAVASTGTTLALAVILIPKLGIEGAGVAWLIAQLATALLALVMSGLAPSKILQVFVQAWPGMKGKRR